MSTPLRSFLMLRLPDGNWSVSVHRELEAILEEWKARPSPEITGGVLHIGFDRPPSKSFEELSATYAGRLLVTGSTKFSLPKGFESSEIEVGKVDDLPVFLGTRGWGYTISEDALPTAPSHTAHNSFSGWIEEFSLSFPDEAEQLRASNIFDEDDYIRGESTLDEKLRVLLGTFRTKSLLKNDSYDLCELAKAAPPWLSERPLSTMDLPVRAANVFEKAGILTVGDLASTTLERLLKTPNFGRKSASDVLSALEIALSEGPHTFETKIQAAGQVPLIKAIRASLADSSDRERDIVFRRMGLEQPAQTLQKIAEDYGLTRERVRQIEAKAVARMIRTEYWDDLLTLKLEKMLKGRDFPMPVLGIEAADPWFEGIGQRSDVLRYILENVCDIDAGVICIDGIDYFAFLTQEQWETAISEGQRLLSSGVGAHWTKDHCRTLIDGLLPANAIELRSILWEKSAHLCHFSSDGSGDDVLTAYGRGAEQVVEAILNASEHPLHYSEIAPLASEKAGRPIDIRRAHSAAADVGLLLGPGTYGVERHLPVRGASLEALGEEAEEVVQGGTPGRQWHTSEILAVLSERGRVDEEIDKYVLDIALQRSGGLERLGRMVWAENSDQSSRIDLRQAVIALLRDAGRPLRSNEIRQRLIALRGVNQYFQIPAADPLIRVSPGTWGINDRDIPVKRSDQPKLISALIAELERKGVGIHISEVKDIVAIGAPEDLSPEALFSIAVADPRIKADVAQYIFLSEWGSARRESLREAVRNVLTFANRPLSFDEIVGLVYRRIARDFPRNAVSGCLQSMGATLDPTTGRWTVGESGDVTDDDEEEERQSRQHPVRVRVVYSDGTSTNASLLGFNEDGRPMIQLSSGGIIRPDPSAVEIEMMTD